MKTLAILFAAAAAAGLFGFAVADNHNIPPLSASTNGDSFTDGDTLSITGSIKNIDPDFMGAVTIQIVDPNNNIVQIGQTSPSASGDFVMEASVGGPNWKNDGEYTIRVSYITDHATLTIDYTGGPEMVAPVPEPDPVCGPGTQMVGGVCQIVDIPEPEPEPEPPADIPPPPPAPEPEPEPVVCGAGTEMVDGECRPIADENGGGGCLIATAAFGTEMAPQVQYLREVRDNTVMSTDAGTGFMSWFNTLYYSVSPQIADMERENPVFREMVRMAITPMLASLSVMSLAEEGSEISVLGTGILVITLNIVMYLVAPVLIGFKAYGRIQSRMARA